jgi:hypothetical protein
MTAVLFASTAISHSRESSMLLMEVSLLSPLALPNTERRSALLSTGNRIPYL